MHDAGKAEKGVIRPEFNRSVMIDFQGAKITSDAGVLMLRDFDERFGIIGQMEGDHAVADVLFGDFNPCGKLPCVWPKNEDQCVPLNTRAADVEYGYLHGYRYQEKMGFKPEFPFGFGLSYTSYRYCNLRLDQDIIGKDGTVTARIDVTNTGLVAGREAVQLYVSYLGSQVERSPKDLRAFAKVALAPGATETVALEVKARDLAYYDVDASKWVVEKIEYEVKVGPSADDDDLLTARFRVKG